MAISERSIGVIEVVQVTFRDNLSFMIASCGYLPGKGQYVAILIYFYLLNINSVLKERRGVVDIFAGSKN